MYVYPSKFSIFSQCSGFGVLCSFTASFSVDNLWLSRTLYCETLSWPPIFSPKTSHPILGKYSIELDLENCNLHGFGPLLQQTIAVGDESITEIYWPCPGHLFFHEPTNGKKLKRIQYCYHQNL